MVHIYYQLKVSYFPIRILIMSDEDQHILEENRRLRRAVEELTTLNELTSAIAALRDSQEIMDTIIRLSLKSIHAQQGVITLIDFTEKQEMKTLIRANVSSGMQDKFHLDQNLLGWMHINRKPLMMNDPSKDERFKGVKWDESIHSLLCVPMQVKAELIGVLTIYNKKGDQDFIEGDQRLLAIIAGQSAQVVENARLYEEEKEYFKMQDEVKVASQIQNGLLPKFAPQIEGYDLAGISIPAQAVGGDYFDFIEIEGNKLGVCLGDVTGKGMPAALLMANLQATIRGFALTTSSANDCVYRANKLLVKSTDLGKFVTLFYGNLDLRTHLFSFSNAGHDSPFLVSKSERVSRLNTGGTILGFLEESQYLEEIVTFKPGDTLVIYSDGITEAMNSFEEEFGEDRVCQIVQNNMDKSAAELIEQILAAINGFSEGTPRMDDMTLVVVKRKD